MTYCSLNFPIFRLTNWRRPALSHIFDLDYSQSTSEVETHMKKPIYRNTYV